ncbi:arylsulfatase [Paenarthrobacter sp. PH39-S1]|uniref:sulfatase family protein n=1 Tax=Paenarthrobacter sp. PH39-S1 TaxID=3046204 RepID=UPI0024BAAC20|nr:arylsulfatase [Paenarthrobacter sp. PH39-S1]MDJ0358162.1 arylsulfatase [Paenarthrobacter sp. PH39-S1]
MMKPNVVIVLADDLGWGDLSCYGATRIHTPNLDALAARGVRFTDSHASSAVCTPSRYSLLTGSYPWRSPLKSGVLGGLDPAIIAVDAPTLPRDFHDAGYRTGAFGKWHLGLGWTDLDGSTRDAFSPGFAAEMQGHGRDIDYNVPFRGGPTALGFETYFGIAGSLDMPPYCFLDQDRAVGVPLEEKTRLVTSQRPGLQSPGWQDDAVDTTVVARAADWIRAQRGGGEPFFAYVATAAPHRPCVPPEFVRGTTEAGPRGDGVALVDWMVGELVGALGEALENTVFVFTSDNGAPTMFPDDGDVVVHRPNGHWRGQKADAWEAGHRVPLIVAGPGIAANKVCDELVSLMDIRATLAEHTAEPAGVRGGAEAVWRVGDGTSFAPLLRRESADAGVARVLGHQAYDGTLVLRSGSGKAIFGTGSGGFSEPVGKPDDTGNGPGQFFDLADDPTETTNLWPNRAGQALDMIETFERTTGFIRGTR